MKKCFITCFIASLLAVASLAQQLPVDTALHMGVLPNGMTYYVRHNSEPKGRAECYLVHKVGSILEGDDECGVAHFLEHIAFNGTEHFPGLSMINYLTSCGMTYGGDINASTSFDQTIYHISNVPTTRTAVLDSVLLVMSDLTGSLAIDSAAVEKEKGIIEEEWRSRNNATVRIYEQALPRLMGSGSLYARRIPIGDIDFVRRASREQLVSFYNRWFRPDLQAIVIVGDFDAREMERKVIDVFSALPSPSAECAMPCDETDVTTPAVAIGIDDELTTPAINLYFPRRKPAKEQRNTLEYLKSNVYSQATAIMINERLNIETKSPDAAMQYAACVMTDFLVSSGDVALTLTASPRGTLSREALHSLLTCVRSVQEHGFTAGELSRAKELLITTLRRAQSQQQARTSAQYVAEYVDHFVNGGYIPGVEWECEASVRCLEDADIADVNAFVRQIIDFDRVKVLAVGSDSLTVPDEQEVRRVIAQVASSSTPRPVDRATSTRPLVGDMCQAGKIVSRSHDTATGATVLKLSNGATVQLKPCKPGSDEVLLNATSPGGYQASAAYSAAEVRLIDQVVENSALGQWSQAELQQRLSTTPLSIVYQMGDCTDDINGSCHSADIETLLQLNYLYFTAVGVDADAHASLRTRLVSQLQQRLSDPSAAFSDSIATSLYDHSPLYVPLAASQVEAADFDRVLALYRERVACVSDFTFSIAGDFDSDTLEPLIEKYIASLPTTGQPDVVTHGPTYLEGDRDVVFLKKMKSPIGSVFACLMGQMDYSLRNAILTDITGQAIQVALTSQLREALHGTYGADVNTSLSHIDKKWMLQANFETEPTKTQDMVQAFAQVLDMMMSYGTTSHLLDVIKGQMLRQHETAQESPAYWLGVLRDRAMGVDTHTDYAAIIDSLTIDEVNEFITSLTPTTRLRVIMQGY